MQVAPENLPGAGGAPPATEGQPGQGGAPEPQSPYSLQAEFLKDVPPETQALLTPYIKKWDGLVTKKFQEVHSQYEPFKQLGQDPATLQQALAIYNALDEQPQVIFNLLKQELEGAGPEGGAPELQPGQQPGEPGEGPYGLPPEFMQRYDRVEQMIGQLAEIVLNNSKSAQEKDEDAQFEQYLSGLKQSHGDFDEDWVTLQISRGMDGEEAVQAWQQKAQEIINAQGGGNGDGRPTPPVLGGGGNVPTEQVNIADIPRGDLRKMVTGMLSQGG